MFLFSGRFRSPQKSAICQRRLSGRVTKRDWPTFITRLEALFHYAMKRYFTFSNIRRLPYNTAANSPISHPSGICSAYSQLQALEFVPSANIDASPDWHHSCPI